MTNDRQSKRIFYLELKQFHRRLGMALAAFFIFIASTGLMLNHSSEMNLDRHTIPAMLARGYFSQMDTPLGFMVQDQWVYSLDGKLRWQDSSVADCQTRLRSLVFLEDVFALCGDYLLVLTLEGELIEEIPGYGVIDTLGLPEIQGIGVDLNYSFMEKEISWPEQKVLDQELVDKHLPSVSWEKWLLDIHSGSYFGGAGKLFLDLVAILLIVAAVSGLYMGLYKPAR